jgi:hypothetical protein
VSPEIIDTVEALLIQREDQGFDTPAENVAEALSRLLANVERQESAT